MTEEEVIQARELATRWDGAWEVDGRTIRPSEMAILRTLTRCTREQRIAQYECSDCLGPWDDGHCAHGIGRCRYVTEALALIQRNESDGI
jgi:hypothetical protein